ncbi:unnamed protein product, partial [Aphanomyces euteiches]
NQGDCLALVNSFAFVLPAVTETHYDATLRLSFLCYLRRRGFEWTSSRLASVFGDLRALKVDSFDTPSRQLAGNEGGRHMGRSEIKGRKIGGQAGSVAGAVAGGTIGGTGGVASGVVLGSVITPVGSMAGAVAGGLAGAYAGGSAGRAVGKKAGTAAGGKIGRQFDKRREKKNLKNFEAANPRNPARLTRRHSEKFRL